MNIQTATTKIFDKYPSCTIHHDETNNIATVFGASSARIKLLFNQSLNVLTVDQYTSVLLLELL